MNNIGKYFVYYIFVMKMFTVFHVLFCYSIETFGLIPVNYEKHDKFSGKHVKSFDQKIYHISRISQESFRMFQYYNKTKREIWYICTKFAENYT